MTKRLFLRSFCRFWNPGPDKMLPLPRLLTPRQVTKCYACHENRQCSILRMSQSAINKSVLFAMKSASSASSRNHVVSAAQRGEAYCSALTANGCGRSSNAGRTRLYLHSSTKTLRYAFGKRDQGCQRIPSVRKCCIHYHQKYPDVCKHLDGISEFESGLTAT